MLKRLIRPLAAVALLAAALPAMAGDATPAKVLFGKASEPAPLESRSIGFYSRGCLAGAKALPTDGTAWQVMRLSRNRFWGMPSLVDYIEKLANDAKAEDGWPGLLVGDMSQPRGGPMASGHASHQIGLDVDIWFLPMPDRVLTREEREKTSAISLIRPGTHTTLDRSRWSDALYRMLRRAASYPEVDRIFVNAGIKKQLCEQAGTDRAWLRKIRPWDLHDDHLHARLSCPPGMAGCTKQEPVPPGDGCGADLAWWLGPEPYKPPPKPEKPVKPAPPITLANLPPACAEVLAAMPGGVTSASVVPIPRERPKPN